MTGFDSKRQMAQDKLDDDDDTQVYADTLLIAYQSGFADGKNAAQPKQEPVAYYHPHKGFYWAKPTHISAPTAVDVPPVPLYVKWKAAQRPWQGLTDEEVAIASAEFDLKLKVAFRAGMYKAQIILRKKNDPTY